MSEYSDTHGSELWNIFMHEEGISPAHTQHYRTYINALLAWNDRSNLTRITRLPDIIAYHLQDSIRVRQYASFKPGHTICDIGSGAGFPGLALAIVQPETLYVLLEVNQKKVAFLRHVIALLGIRNVTVCQDDWRTFLRRASLPVQWFVTRASLEMHELMRAFKPGSPYNTAQLIYWASDQWCIGDEEKPFFIKKEGYTVGNARRWYVFFGKNNE